MSNSSRAVVETGVVESGQINLDHPIGIPDGVRVKVSVEELESGPRDSQVMSDAEFRSLPFFGEWADRADLNSSADYAHEERAKWSQRPS